MYLTYNEYLQYGGATLASPDSEWALLEFEARKRIDYLTANRVAAMATVPEAVKMAMCKIIRHNKTYGTQAQADNPLTTSFNTDGYSESYGHALSAEDAEKEMTRRIQTDLYGEVNDYGVPLLYRGVR